MVLGSDVDHGIHDASDHGAELFEACDEAYFLSTVTFITKIEHYSMASHLERILSMLSGNAAVTWFRASPPGLMGLIL